jgi:hypothetical protein
MRKEVFLGNTHVVSPQRTLCWFFVCNFLLLSVPPKQKKEMLSCTTPNFQTPRPPSSPRTFKHTQRKRSLPLQLFPPPLILIPCPPPRLNSRMHLLQITHPHHNRHPSLPRLCLTHRPRNSDPCNFRLPNNTYNLTRRIAHSARRRVPRWRSRRRRQKTHTERRSSEHLRYVRACTQSICERGQRGVLQCQVRVGLDCVEGAAGA